MNLQDRPKQHPEETTLDFRTRAVDWMQLQRGAILTTQPELEYVVQIIDKSISNIEKGGELSAEQITKEIDRVNVALSHAKNQTEQRQNLEAMRSYGRSELIARLEDDEINLARARIENRMFRAPIILVPFALLVAAFGLAVMGVIDIRGQKIDVDEVVKETVDRLTKQLETKGNVALEAINNELEKKSTEIAEFDVSTQISNAVAAHVEDKGKNTFTQIQSKLIAFNETFPEQELSATIQKVETTSASASALEEQVNEIGNQLTKLNGKIGPLKRSLNELRDSNADSFKTISTLADRAEWMVYAGVIGLGVAVFSLIVTVFLAGWLVRKPSSDG